MRVLVVDAISSPFSNVQRTIVFDFDTAAKTVKFPSTTSPVIATWSTRVLDNPDFVNDAISVKAPVSRFTK